jgi:hypothetical protein
VSIFQGRKKLGLKLLAAWLIVTGLAPLIRLDFPLMNRLMAALAIAAGVLIALDR